MLNHREKLRLARRMSSPMPKGKGPFDSPEWENHANGIAARVAKRGKKK